MIQPILPFLLFFAIWPLSGDDPLATGFPTEASGTIRFQADVVLFEEDGVIAPEVSIAIPRDALEAELSDSLRVRVAVAMLDRDGQARVEYQTELPLDPDSTAGETSTFPVPERWLRLHPKWFEGTRGMRITVEDVTRLKVGLLDKLRGEHPAGVAEGRLDWPMRRLTVSDSDSDSDSDSELDPDSDAGTEFGSDSTAVDGGIFGADEADGLLMSGLLFAWAQADEKPASGLPGFRSVRARLHPNPFHYYGLHQPVMTVYWERYGLPPEVEDGAPLVLVHEITALEGAETVTVVRNEVAASNDSRWELQRFDVSKLASGAYRLDVRIERPDGTVLAATDGEFQVVWERRRWTEDEQTLLRYAELLLLSRAEHESLLVMDRGAQEEFLRRFWDRLYPTSPGEPNPKEAEFLRRIEFANREFGTKAKEGYRTDQGRVFIRFGSPDEITFNLNPQDRELLAYVLPQEIDDPGESLEARLRQTKRRSLRDNRAYEVWDYFSQGDPLIPEFAGMQHGLKFIFVDELGVGDFLLVYSNLPGNLR